MFVEKPFCSTLFSHFSELFVCLSKGQLKVSHAISQAIGIFLQKNSLKTKINGNTKVNMTDE